MNLCAFATVSLQENQFPFLLDVLVYVQKKVQQIAKQKQTATTYSMGDASDVLAKLKAKMEGQ